MIMKNRVSPLRFDPPPIHPPHRSHRRSRLLDAIYFPYVGNVLGANDRIAVACIGCKRAKARAIVSTPPDERRPTSSPSATSIKTETACKVDQLQEKASWNKFPDIKQYQDYRKTVRSSSARTLMPSPFPRPTINHGSAGIARAQGWANTFSARNRLPRPSTKPASCAQLAKEKEARHTKWVIR